MTRMNPSHINTGETSEEVQDTGPAFDNNLDLDVNNNEIEEDSHIFMVMAHLVNPCHFICTLSTVSGHLAEAFAKNSKPKGFYETMLMALHTYEDVFSEMVFNVLIIQTPHKPWNTPRTSIMRR
jgi:hypothetical protein